MYSYLSGLTLSLGVSFLFEVLDTLDFFSANDSSLYEIFIAERFIFFFFFFSLIDSGIFLTFCLLF